jgi:hypothetical protein
VVAVAGYEDPPSDAASRIIGRRRVLIRRFVGNPQSLVLPAKVERLSQL